jgi:hypothetical protein
MVLINQEEDNNKKKKKKKNTKANGFFSVFLSGNGLSTSILQLIHHQ